VPVKREKIAVLRTVLFNGRTDAQLKLCLPLLVLKEFICATTFRFFSSARLIAVLLFVGGGGGK
jgi:hypothetical protein